MAEQTTDPAYLRREADATAAAVGRLEEKVEKARRDLDAAEVELDDARAAADAAENDAVQAEDNQPHIDGDPNGDSVDAYADTAAANLED